MINLRDVALVLLFAMGGSRPVAAGDRQGLNPHLQRPPDVPTERLDRPLRETDRPPQDKRPSALTQAQAIALAKAAAGRELGTTFREFEVRTVVFDPTKHEWSVTFDLTPLQRTATSCVTVFVNDETRATDVFRCT